LIKKLLILLTISGTLFFSCSQNPTNKDNKDSAAFDLDSIMARGKLVAVTDFNSTNYFLYKGEPMGFHYELLKAFSDHLGIDIEIVSENSIENAFRMLKEGQVDLLAMGLTVTPSRKDEIRFTEPIDSTRQVLVQRKPHKWQKMSFSAFESKMIRKYSDLANKSIYVQKGSSHTGLLSQLSKEIGLPVTIIEVPFEAEALIELVDKGEISYAVCDENLAAVNATYFPEIDVATQLNNPQNLAWGIRKTNSEQLKKELDQWIINFKTTQTFAILYSKYFKNSRSSAIVKSNYYALTTGKVSQWDDLIKKYSATIHWDWRLLASLICQESRFMPDVISRVGAYGLMQVMPETGKNFGIDITSSPENNIKAGAKFINWLYNIFDPMIPDDNERTKFILASYNAGPGHVLDAMKLAEKNGMDPHKWDGNVAVWILKKSEPQYYNDIVVKYGYFKGKESVAFVSEILERFEHYKNIIPENNEPISYIPHNNSPK
jgi:membrane-bound lytic murein transglycosylase F